VVDSSQNPSLSIDLIPSVLFDTCFRVETLSLWKGWSDCRVLRLGAPILNSPDARNQDGDTIFPGADRRGLLYLAVGDLAFVDWNVCLTPGRLVAGLPSKRLGRNRCSRAACHEPCGMGLALRVAQRSLTSRIAMSLLAVRRRRDSRSAGLQASEKD